MTLDPPPPARQHMVVALPGPPPDAVPGMRAVREDDAEFLADLMMSAYVGTVDYEGETRAEAVDAIRDTFGGGNGPFDWGASRVIERDAVLASATLITSWRGEPFVCFSMSDARLKRRGLGRACMVAAMDALSRRGEARLRLLVTRANLPAVRLYEGLGFRWEEGC